MTHQIHVNSTRLRGWDYTCAAWYFVTLCTHQRKRTLGEMIEGQMRLSVVGKIVREEWLLTETIRPNVALDEFVVMPNHIHGIVVLKEASQETRLRGVSTRNGIRLPTLGTTVRRFKSRAKTKRIWAAGYRDFAWQPRFHDHIIRSEPSLNAVRRYIRDNPAKWALDKDNLEGLRM